MADAAADTANSLAPFGTVLTWFATLPPTFYLTGGGQNTVDQMRRTLSRTDGPRAVLLVGPSGAGKTALVHGLSYALFDEGGGQHLVQLSLTALMVGSGYIGIWEERVNNLIELAARTATVVYVPSLVDLAAAGRHSKSDHNMAAAFAEPLARGGIAMVAESTPEAYRSLVSREPGLVRLFEVIQVEPASVDETRRVLAAVVRETPAIVDAPVLDRAVELAGEFLVGSALPGAAVDLVRRAISRAPDPGCVTVGDLLATLSAATGLPREYLDDAVPLDRAAVRAFLEARVLGQPEAVDAVMERVALIKAGLTDPERPYGVLLFTGPTGVGKTELARALAELLFGDATRMIRLDMSEFAKADSYERLIGTYSQPGVLTDPVRSQPFSLVLLDEIEKSHLNVFDLCLQLFDAGRLTDGKGLTADFRRTIIILTTNVGATIARTGTVGFMESRTESPEREEALHAERELAMAFRPEFLNRLDHVVRFRPLEEQVVARIAERELRRVLERSGIRRRGLVLDVDPSLLALLLREGYSRAFGARPLKRAVERKVLLPVAWALARGDAAPGSTVRLAAVSGQVRISIAAPEAPHRDGAPDLPEVNGGIDDLREQAEKMHDEIDGLVEAFSPMQTRLSARVLESASPGFYGDPERSRAVLDEIYRLDGARREVEAVRAAIAGFAERVRRRVRDSRELAALNRQARTLEGRLDHVAFIVSCEDLEALGDAYLTMTRLQNKDQSLQAVARLAGMYRAFTERRGLTCEVVDDRVDPESGEDSITLLVSGCGAHALLAGESGLHRFRDGLPPRDVLEAVRVAVLPMPPAVPNFPADAVSIEARSVARPGRLMRAVTLELRLFHRPTKIALRAACDGSREWALERILPLFFASIRQATTPPPVEERLVRRYQLGPSPRVRDLRTGYATGRLERVLRGDIEMFVTGHRRE